MPEISCASCSGTFFSKRSHARYCSDKCRHDAWVKSQENGSEGGSQRVSRSARRPSRNGYGTRIYLTESELNFLARAVVAYEPAGGPALDRLVNKFLHAGNRLNRKES
jgi:hypothetical protein